MRKIALVGTASSATAAPYNDESWEIWGVATRAQFVTRANRWFELHRIEGEGEDWAENWRKSLKAFSHDVELLMFYPEPNLGPKVSTYPTERITQRFGTYFMTSSFAWMIALAIDELRPEKGKPVKGEIGIWGVEMEYGTEYREQRAGFRHFIDLARVMGIGITRLAGGGLAYEPVPYPLWQDDPLLTKLAIRTKVVQDSLARFDKSIRLTRTQIAQNNAVMQELGRLEQADYDVPARLAELEKETAGLMEMSGNLSKDIVRNEAYLEEQQWLKDYLSP